MEQTNPRATQTTPRDPRRGTAGPALPPDGTDDGSAKAPPAGGPPAGPEGGLQRGRLPAWLGGTALATVAAGALVANLLLPWLTLIDPAGARTVASWSDLRDPTAVAYEKRLLLWPLWACGGAAVAGILMALRGRSETTRPPRLHGLLQGAASWLVAAAGLLLTLTGTRWLGFAVARALPEGPSPVHLHAAPWLDLGLGLALLATAGWRLWPRLHRAGPAATALVAALGLLALPLIPFGEVRIQGTAVLHLDEFTLAVLAAERPRAGLGAPEALGWIRVTLWTALGLSATSLAVVHAADLLPAGRRWLWLRHAVTATILPVLAGLALAFVFYDRLGEVVRDDVRIGYNLIAPLTLAALGVLWAVHVRGLLRASGRGRRA